MVTPIQYSAFTMSIYPSIPSAKCPQRALVKAGELGWLVSGFDLRHGLSFYGHGAGLYTNTYLQSRVSVWPAGLDHNTSLRDRVESSPLSLNGGALVDHGSGCMGERELDSCIYLGA